jgi:peptidoglycan hydrolase-like protein with peptidoglycan-binding domain
VLNSKARTTACYASVPLVKKTSYATAMLGSRAATVKVAQKALGVKQTGTFDLATRDAVKAWQRKHDLPWTGALDQPTWASLVPSKVTSDVSAGMTAEEAAVYGARTYTSTLKERSTGKAVLVLQVALGMKRVDRNGYLGPVTVAAVRARQEALGRTPTGSWTKDDWAALAS